MSSFHFTKNREGNGISADVPNRDSAIVTSNAEATLCWSLAFLTCGDNIGPNLIDKVVRTSAIDRFPASESGGVVGSGHSIFWFSTIFMGRGIVCVDTYGPCARRGFLSLPSGL